MVQSQVLEAKVFHSPYGTGIAIVTGSSRFTLATNIEDLKLRRLPEVPGKEVGSVYSPDNSVVLKFSTIHDS